MGDFCEILQASRRRAAQNRLKPQTARRDFTTIAEPLVGNHLSVRTAENGVKGLVCEARNIIACLASGDRVWITWSHKQHRIWKELGLSRPTVTATFRNEGNVRDTFVFQNGRTLPLQALSRKADIQVVYVAPRDHVHEALPEYDAASIQGMLDAIPLPASDQSETRCGSLVSA